MTINYVSFPGSSTVFTNVCKMDELINVILVPHSILCMNQKGKPFEIYNEEMKAFLGMNIMMSYNVLLETYNYFST